MQRLLALAVATVQLSSVPLARPLHVHLYAGHDHADHHHGPASHDHVQPVAAHPDDHADQDGQHAPVIEAVSCDAGRHAVGVSAACTNLPRIHVSVGELPGPWVYAPARRLSSTLPFTDVRAHGPPSIDRRYGRAPPVPHA